MIRLTALKRLMCSIARWGLWWWWWRRWLWRKRRRWWCNDDDDSNRHSLVVLTRGKWKVDWTFVREGWSSSRLLVYYSNVSRGYYSHVLSIMPSVCPTRATLYYQIIPLRYVPTYRDQEPHLKKCPILPYTVIKLVGLDGEEVALWQVIFV